MSSEKDIILDIKIWLVKKDMNQTDLAKMLGVSKQYVSDFLNGKVRIPVKVIKLVKDNK
jgi:predicted XRE-type DNA-binding protein